VTSSAGAVNAITTTFTGGVQLALGANNIIIYAAGGGELAFAAGAGGFTGTIDNVTCTEVAESTIDLSSGDWVRATIENKTITNPYSAIKLATSGDAVDVALCGVESGAFVTSPIPTIASQILRAADNITLATSAFPHIDSAGTLYFEGSTIAPGTSRALLSFDNGTTNERIWLSVNVSNRIAMSITDGAATQASIDVLSGTTSANVTFKSAAVYALDDFAAVFNGGSPTTDSLGTLPTCTTLRIGIFSTGGPLNGYVRKAMYLPRRMINGDLQTLTVA
jgi:hypothetical protein